MSTINFCHLSWTISYSNFYHNILGNDGLLVGWDVSSYKKMGSIICHQGISIQIPGRQNRRMLRCCPVGASLLKGKLLILCRDGYLTEWNYGVIEENGT